MRKSFFNLIIPYWIESCPHDCVLWRSAEIMGTAYAINKPLILWRKHFDSSWQVEIEKETADSELKWRKQEIKELEELIKFVGTRNIFAGFKLLNYLKIYPSFKKYVKDWFIAFLR